MVHKVSVSAFNAEGDKAFKMDCTRSAFDSRGVFYPSRKDVHKQLKEAKMDITKLATIEEIKETNITMQHLVKYMPTFQMGGKQFYRIIAPQGHPHLNSDMTIQGMQDWKII